MSGPIAAASPWAVAGVADSALAGTQ
jgi:hypothetical protein